MELKLNRFSYQDIKPGDQFLFERFVDDDLVKEFSKLSGDGNPLHTDDSYAKKTQFGGRIVHGMLISSFFSALVGMLCPGERSLYLTQSLNFKNPLKPNNLVIIWGRVENKSDAARIVCIKTVARDKHGVVLIDGEAKVKVL